MNKRLTLLLLLCFVLTACGTAPAAPSSEPSSEQPTDPPAASEPVTEPTTSEEPTQTVPPQTEPLADGTPLTAEELAQLQELFVDYHGWYSRFLISHYSEPKEIDLYMLFYKGIPGVDDTLSEDERAYLETVWEWHEFMLDDYRLPAAQMNETLQTYMGLSMEDTLGIGLEHMTYWAEADCYYVWHGDTNAIQVLIHSAYRQDDGTIIMFYSNGNFDKEAEAAPEHVAVLLPCDDGYQFISNQPAESGNNE